jgi:hypothetical protein
VSTAPSASGPPSPATCSDASLAAGEALAGTATQAASWLLVERRGAWGRDAVADSGLEDGLRAALEAFAGRVLLVRRPDRRAAETIVYHAVTDEDGGRLERRIAASADELPATVGAAPGAAEEVSGPLLLVCAHGRRDACCARLGVPVYDALAARLDPLLLWQSSHHGGHRFAANVLALPAGVQLGRLSPSQATDAARRLAGGRIPLEHYRGRTLYTPRVQAAEVEVRLRLGLDRPGDIRLLEDDGERVGFAHATGEVAVAVEARPGPATPASCGQEPEETVAYSVRW